MTNHYNVSVGKVGSRYYWIVLKAYVTRTADTVAAEGFAETRDQGKAAAVEAAARLGLDATPTTGGVAQSFYSHFRARKRKVPDHPELAEFQGEKYLLGSVHYWDSGIR
jgi:hypothetical protein